MNKLILSLTLIIASPAVAQDTTIADVIRALAIQEQAASAEAELTPNFGDRYYIVPKAASGAYRSNAIAEAGELMLEEQRYQRRKNDALKIQLDINRQTKQIRSYGK